MDLPSYLVECPSCGISFEGQWGDDSMDIEQMDAAPEDEQTCPECERTFWAVYPGWTEFGGAG